MILKYINVSNLERGKFMNVELDFDLSKDIIIVILLLNIYCYIIDEMITSAKIALKINYEHIPYTNEFVDFCDAISQMNKQCPLEKGHFNWKIHTFVFTSFPPSVSIYIIR